MYDKQGPVGGDERFRYGKAGVMFFDIACQNLFHVHDPLIHQLEEDRRREAGANTAGRSILGRSSV
jgi:hypothetical protein